MSQQLSDQVELPTVPSVIDENGEVWILHVPRFGPEGQHYHSYGLLTPYFKGLKDGKLLGTRCVNAGCPISQGAGELWLPPRADCPDCHHAMEWAEVPTLEGYVYTYTRVVRGGTGLEIEVPYYQIDVKLDGVCTIVKSYLSDRKPVEIGQKVRAAFLSGDRATHTSLDLYFDRI